MKHALWILLCTAALAGCSGDGDGTASGPQCLENQYLDAAGACADHVEPHIVLAGLPATVQQFKSVEFAWRLDPGTRAMDGTVHSMDSRILASATAGTTDNTTAPDAWGTQVAQAQHKDLPHNATGTLRWDEQATLYVKGYMLIDGQHVWQDLTTVDVVALTATGNRTTVPVTIDMGPPSIPSETTIKAGDGVTITNDENNPIEYVVTLTGANCPAGSATLARQGGTLDLDFLMPGSCSITLNTQLIATGEDPGELTTKVTVGAP